MGYKSLNNYCINSFYANLKFKCDLIIIRTHDDLVTIDHVNVIEEVASEMLIRELVDLVNGLSFN